MNCSSFKINAQTTHNNVEVVKSSMKDRNTEGKIKAEQNGRIEGRNVYEQAYDQVLGKEIKRPHKK